MSQDLAATVAGLEALREREYSKMGMRAEWDIQANKHIATLTAAIAMLHEQETTVRNCADICKRIAEKRFEEFGITESDTGASYYSKRVSEEYETRDEEDDNCAAAILTAYKLEPK